MTAYKGPQGVSFSIKSGGSEFRIACGQCMGCRLERSRQWAVRCVHESKMHEFSCFVTLTYDDVHLPVDGYLDYRHFQLFMKRLRKRFRDVPINFYMCGEYGDEFGRPHYHALLFGIDFFDKLDYREGESGFMVSTSATLDKLWGLGQCFTGDVSFESAAYCARYIVKKLSGKAVVKIDSRYSIDVATGEIFVPEFTHMSLKRPIGRAFFEKFQSEIFPHDRVVVRGKVSLPPRYYSRVYKRIDPDSWDDVSKKRERFRVGKEGVPDRVRQRAICLDARLALLKRGCY
nr:MAG: replication initiator protein [Microviridae sp.]